MSTEPIASTTVSSSRRARKSTSSLLDLDSAISLAIERCDTQSALPSTVLSEEDLDLLSPETLRAFALDGWIHLTSKRHLEMRHGHQGEENGSSNAPARSPRPGSHPVSGRNPYGAWKPLDNIRWQSADGGMKKLIEFNLSDLDFMVKMADSQINGWTKKREWADVARQVLESKKAKSIDKLSLEDKNELGRLAREAWP